MDSQMNKFINVSNKLSLIVCECHLESMTFVVLDYVFRYYLLSGTKVLWDNGRKTSETDLLHQIINTYFIFTNKKIFVDIISHIYL